MKKKYKMVLVILSLLASLAVTAFCYLKEIKPINDYGQQVASVSSVEKYADETLFFCYRGFFTSIGFQRIGESDEASARSGFFSYLFDCNGTVIFRLMTSMAVYAMLFMIVGSYFFKSIFQKSKFSLPVAGIGYLAAAAGLCMYMWFNSSITISAPTSYQIMSSVSAVLALLAMGMFAEMLYNRFNRKMLVWIFVTVLLFVGYVTGVINKDNLYSPAYNKSFAYVGKLDERFNDEKYDEEIIFNEDGSITFFGNNYEPELIPNENHAFGVKRVLCFAEEVLSPSAGMYNTFMDNRDISALIPAAYSVQAIIWMVISGLLNRKK